MITEKEKLVVSLEEIRTIEEALLILPNPKSYEFRHLPDDQRDTINKAYDTLRKIIKRRKKKVREVKL